MNTTPAARALLLVALLSGLAACNRRDEAMGPAQKAGAAIDNAGDKVARKLEENLQKADRAGQEMADAARTAGDKIEDATRDARRGLDETTDKVGKKVERAGEKIQDAARPN